MPHRAAFEGPDSRRSEDKDVNANDLAVRIEAVVPSQWRQQWMLGGLEFSTAAEAEEAKALIVRALRIVGASYSQTGGVWSGMQRS